MAENNPVRNLKEEITYFHLLKQRWMIPLMAFCCPLWFFIGWVFLGETLTSLFTDQVNFDAGFYYFFSVVVLILFIPLALMLPIGYFHKDLRITNKSIFLKKGISGKRYIIDIDSVLAFQKIETKYKASAAVKIFFYLKSGRKINTGILYSRKHNLSLLLDKLEELVPRVSAMKEIRDLKFQPMHIDQVETELNPMIPVISWSPMVLAAVMILCYVSGYNEMGGTPINIQGTIEERRIDYANPEEISGYTLVVYEEKTGNIYEVPVEENGYRSFEPDDWIQITGIKGKLGIPYHVELWQ